MSTRIERFLVKILGIINSVLSLFCYRLVKMNHYFNRVGVTEHDYVRFSTFALLSMEIKRRGLSGDIAELGVFRGDFAKNMNSFLPEKALYLFDTFEGFDERDVKLERKKAYSKATQNFTDTSIDLVLKKMKHPEKCKVVKGYFPDSLNQLPNNNELEFCFVSIDADLYQPIYDGLCYFYPRLCKGGYIMVHDFNNLIYKGVKEAVYKFISENPTPYVPISDPSGSIIIIKS